MPEEPNTAAQPSGHGLPTPADFWHWSSHAYGQRPLAWLEVQTLGGNVNLALLLHWLDQAGLIVDPAPLQGALAETDAVLIPWRVLRKRIKPRLDEAEYQAMLAHELALERLQQAALLQTLPSLPLVRGEGDNLLNYLSLLGARPSLLRDLIC